MNHLCNSLTLCVVVGDTLSTTTPLFSTHSSSSCCCLFAPYKAEGNGRRKKSSDYSYGTRSGKGGRSEARRGGMEACRQCVGTAPTNLSPPVSHSLGLISGLALIFVQYCLDHHCPSLFLPLRHGRTVLPLQATGDMSGMEHPNKW